MFSLLNSAVTNATYPLSVHLPVPAALDQLAQSSNPHVRARVAEHENTPLPTLFKLTQDESAEVRQSVTFNPKSNAEILLQLAEDSHPDVRYSIAENALVPPAILHKLSGDDNPYIAQRALKTLSRLQKVISACAQPLAA